MFSIRLLNIASLHSLSESLSKWSVHIRSSKLPYSFSMKCEALHCFPIVNFVVWCYLVSVLGFIGYEICWALKQSRVTLFLWLLVRSAYFFELPSGALLGRMVHGHSRGNSKSSSCANMRGRVRFYHPS